MQPLAQQARFLEPLLDGLGLPFQWQFGRSSTARIIIRSVKVRVFPPIKPLAHTIPVNFINIRDWVNRVTPKREPDYVCPHPPPTDCIRFMNEVQ